MENRIATTIDQSKKLLELGIDVNTADMWYQHIGYSIIDGKEKQTYFPMVIRDNISDDDLPAWTLSALLGMMPKLYEFGNDHNDGGCQPNLCKGWNNNRWHIVYRSSIYITNWYDDPIDAAFEMVVWLLENGKI